MKGCTSAIVVMSGRKGAYAHVVYSISISLSAVGTITSGVSNVVVSPCWLFFILDVA